MKSLKLALLSLAAVTAITAASAADAHGRRHRGHIGLFIGAPFFAYHAYPRYYYPPSYYYPPTVVVPAPAAPPVYIEQGIAPAPATAADTAPSAQASTAYWYYCRDSQTYYPYVQSCATPWQRVVPQAPPPS